LFFTIVIAALVAIAISGCLGEDEATPKIAAITPGEMPNYIGQQIGIDLAPNAILDENSYSYFYKESVMIGKISSIQKTSIHRDYKVYDTKEGVKIATGKLTRLTAEKNVTVIGTVKEDGYTSGNLIIYADEIVRTIEPSGEI
jgi:hypothetical protein